jgi:hypothetical protein
MSSDGVNMYGLEVLAFFFLFFWYIISGVMIEHHKVFTNYYIIFINHIIQFTLHIIYLSFFILID